MKRARTTTGHLSRIIILALALIAMNAASLESRLSREGAELETWMNAAARSTMIDEEMVVESWMKTPFDIPEVEVEEDIVTETWMSAPFESAIAEEELIVESWMTLPFETEVVIEEDIEVEQWMTEIWI